MNEQWKAITTEMPDRNVWVLVCGPKWLWAGISAWDGQHWQQDAGQIINDLQCEGIDWGKHNIEVAPYTGVTHWMPLPAVYKDPKHL